MRVYAERMLENLDASYGLVFSQPVLLALVESGLTPRRRLPHRAAQRDAHVGGAPAVPRRAARGPRGDRRARRRAPRRVLRPEARARATSTAPSTCSTIGDSAEARPVSRSRCPHLYSGKVRDLYEVGHDRLLIVASDRISVFDVVLPDDDPRQGPGAHRRSRPSGSTRPRDLVAEPPDLVRPHRLPGDRRPRRRRPGDARAGDPAGATRVHRAGLPVRVGAWSEYQEHGHGAGPRRCRPGCARPSRCRSRSSRPPPRPTRATTCRSPTPRPGPAA